MSVLRQAYYLEMMGISRWEPRQFCVNQPTVDYKDCKNEELSATSLNWQDLQKQVAQCQRCALAQGRTQTVFGIGNQQANLLIVGEAPGFHEDNQGKPFVGRAGQLLTAMLHAIGLKREEVYIANVLKCRPPNNRDPLPEEVAQCTPYLEQQVALLQPKLILALGRYAAHYLLGTKTSLGQLRQQTHFFRNTDIPLIVSYHPAYLLRNSKDKKQAYIDLLHAKSLLEQLTNSSQSILA